VRRRLIQLALSRIRNSTRFESNQVAWNARSEYVKQGLYQGQSILAIDLVSCTRCDECTRACTHQHGTESHGTPFTRLLRTGLRFGDYLVATSCRSCKDAYCMVGCPVDSIHRGRHQQIVIENHCIGCGLCANNCPFGNIFMVDDQHNLREAPDPDHPDRKVMVAQPKAAACDLCDPEGEEDDPTPRCVYSCPHDAAKRMTGDELLKRVVGEAPEKVKE
jgi:Fe-S-cluster-containing hydrogenase component 2